MAIQIISDVLNVKAPHQTSRQTSRPFLAYAVSAVLIGAGMPAMVAGCAPSIESYCQARCECQECSDSDSKECVDWIQDQKKKADDAGCGDAFNNALSCANDGLACTDGSSRVDGCDSENSALLECADGLSIPGITLCETAGYQIIAKYESCDIPLSISGSGDPAECTIAAGNLATCQAACFSNAPCQVLAGEDSSGALELADCIAKC